MKIEIDLKDILHYDEYGSETLQESVRRQVVDAITLSLNDSIKTKIDDEISKVITSQINIIMQAKIPVLIGDLLDYKFQPVDKYGKRSEETTLRDVLHKELSTKLVYQNNSSSYDNNFFTKSVNEVISSCMKEFKKEYTDLINQNLAKEYMVFAVDTLKKKLGLS